MPKTAVVKLPKIKMPRVTNPAKSPTKGIKRIKGGSY